jgi:hypothetical protein
VARKTWNKAIDEAFLEEEDITHHLGELHDEGGYQQTEWHLNVREGTLYRCKEVKWERHDAKQRGRLRFENEGMTVGGPAGRIHKVQATMRSMYVEVDRLIPLVKREMKGKHEPAFSHYKSEIGDYFHSLPKHMRRLVRNIPQLTLPVYLDPTGPQDLIVSADGSVLFDVAYHIWVFSTKDEEIIVQGGGLDDGAPQHMTLYQSALGGVCAGMAVIGAMTRSGKIKIR